MDTKYGNNVLVDFEALVDIDYGIIRYIVREFKDSSYLLPHVVNATEYFAKCLLLIRENKNPLSIIFKKEYHSSIDDILEELVNDETKYKEILELSPPMAMFDVIQAYKRTSGVIKCDILCKNSLQEQYIKRYEKDCKVIVSDSVDTKQYDTIIIKTYANILKHKNVQGKSIIICEYRYNQRKGFNLVLDPSIDVLISKINNTFLVMPYKNFKLPANYDPERERKVVK